MDQRQEQQIAHSRVCAYDTIIGTLFCLPDETFLEIIRGQKLHSFLKAYRSLGQPLLSKGADEILSFLETMEPSAALVETLAVDRTKILRVPQKGSMRPPYESQYCAKEKKEGLLGKLQRAYIESGYIPVDAKDTADFLLIEMDFVKMLIDRGMKERQKQFMEEHLGAWACDYAKAAAEIAETEFYRGWMNFLQGFIRIEMEYLK